MFLLFLANCHCYRTTHNYSSTISFTTATKLRNCLDGLCKLIFEPINPFRANKWFFLEQRRQILLLPRPLLNFLKLVFIAHKYMKIGVNISIKKVNYVKDFEIKSFPTKDVSKFCSLVK